MRPAYAYFGIGLVFLLALIAFVNPGFMSNPKNVSDTIISDTINSTTSTNTMPSSLKLSSPAFAEGSSIPSKYTCDADPPAGSPPLSIAEIPEGTKTFAIIMEDPDVPKQIKPDGIFLHWVIFNIPAETTTLDENTKVGIAGKNGAGKNMFASPCPPAQYEPSEHRYVFTLYALDTALTLQIGASKDEVINAMSGHILAQTELLGRYKKK